MVYGILLNIVHSVFHFLICHDVFLPAGQKAPNDKARKREHREKRKKDRDSRV